MRRDSEPGELRNEERWGGFQGSKRKVREVGSGRLRDPNGMAPGRGQEKMLPGTGGQWAPPSVRCRCCSVPLSDSLHRKPSKGCRHQQCHESAARKLRAENHAPEFNIWKNGAERVSTPGHKCENRAICSPGNLEMRGEHDYTKPCMSEATEISEAVGERTNCALWGPR